MINNQLVLDLNRELFLDFFAGGIWCAWNVDVRVFVRARHRQEAKAEVLDLIPKAVWWR